MIITFFFCFFKKQPAALKRVSSLISVFTHELTSAKSAPYTEINL